MKHALDTYLGEGQMNKEPSYCKRAIVVATTLAVGSVVSLPMVAAAQERESYTLEEVVVTARKREERLQDIPLSVTALSSEDMREANISSLSDIAANTVGFTVNAAFGRSADRPVIRGLSSIFADEELAGYFIDGVFVSGSLQSFDLSAIERVEIIKGPQSAVFGRRTFSGAVNYVTKVPSPGMSGYVTAEIGENGRQSLSGSIEGGSEELSARLTVRSYEYESQFKNTLKGGPDVGGEESRSINLSTYWRPADTLSVHWNLSKQKDDDDHFPLQVLGQEYNNCGLSGGAYVYYCGKLKAKEDIHIGGFLNDYGVERDRLRTFVTIDKQFGDIDVQWTSAFSKTEEQSNFDQSYAGFQGIPVPGLTAREWNSEETAVRHDISHELKVSGDLLDERLMWTLGAYYGNQKDDKVVIGRFVDSDLRIENRALLAGLEYQILPTLRASLEMRYAEDEIQLDSETDITMFSAEQSYYEDTYRFTLSQDVGADGMAYLNIATGTLPGGFNNNPDLPPALIPIEQQEITQYEVGYKAQLTPMLRVSAAAYLLEWTNQAASEFSYTDRLGNFRPAGIGYRNTNGETEVKGIEFDAVALLSQNWELSGGFTWQDAESKKMISTDPKDIVVNNGSADLSGKRVPLTSEWEAVAAVTYRRELSNDWGVRARLDGNYQSERYTRLVNTASTGDQFVANAVLGLENDSWDLSLWVRNLTDEDAIVSSLRYVDATGGFGTAFAVTPRRERELGVTVRYSF